MKDQTYIKYKAFLSRDYRFEGEFYIGVYTTGCYCKPTCPAPSAKFENCCFFDTIEDAADAGFRPCKRCFSNSKTNFNNFRLIAPQINLAIQHILKGEFSISEIADSLNISTRQLNRIFVYYLGVNPTRFRKKVRLILALQKLLESQDLITHVAYDSGYKSIRQFNQDFKKELGINPSQVRSSNYSYDSFLTLSLTTKNNINWIDAVNYLKPRLTPSVERIDKNSYRRTMYLNGTIGTINVYPSNKSNILSIRIPFQFVHVTSNIILKVISIFDAFSNLDEIHSQLFKDPLLNKLACLSRLYGTWDIYELTIRTIIGQQISLKAASTIMDRLVDRFGKMIEQGGHHYKLFPNPITLKNVDLTKIGLTSSRAFSIQGVAEVFEKYGSSINPFFLPDKLKLLDELKKIKGIGPWTLSYIKMRAYNCPDEFPLEDLGLQRAIFKLQNSSEIKRPEMLKITDSWKPWRSYATMSLWTSNIHI